MERCYKQFSTDCRVKWLSRELAGISKLTISNKLGREAEKWEDKNVIESEIKAKKYSRALNCS